ncbi:MAG: enolase C-terminal domain-like protein, partial [Planctomycetota bacterium]
TRDGKRAKGFGSMPLGNVWGFPSKQLAYDDTLGAMKAMSTKLCERTNAFGETGHPIDLGVTLEHEYLNLAGEVSADLDLPEPIPKLATLVTASPFDAAIHDAFGKVHGVSCFATYGKDMMNRDLSAYLGDEYRGRWLGDYVSRTPKASMPLYHLVGALDPLDDDEMEAATGDGLPDTLPEWIRYNGLSHMKIKLNGDDLEWDLNRVVKVDAVSSRAQAERGVQHWFYSLDFNERCESVEYLIEMLQRLREITPQGFERIQYIEQPTARDLKAHPENRMHEAAKLKPVVIDESLTDLETLLLAREMGYTGAALKACKGQSQSLIMAAAIKEMEMFLCVQDLTCPGASLIHSASMAAHIPGVAAIESNSRQYCPAANEAWRGRFPGIFEVKDGQMKTSCLDGIGLGAVAP